MKRFVWIALVVLAVASTSGAATLLNGDFELADLDSNSTWTNWTGGMQGQDWWSAHSGTGGLYFTGWTENSAAGVYQDVAETNKGDYTFSIFVLQEPGFNPTSFELKLEYYDASAAVKVQDDTIADYSGVTPDNKWHHYYVSGTATSDAMEFIRPVIAASWGTTNFGGTAVFLDDAQLYTGSYTGIPSVVNYSFEEGQFFENWRASGWNAVPESGGDGLVKDWADFTGSRIVAFQGWDDAGTTQRLEISQPLTALGTGTFTCAAYMSRELNFLMTNVEFRLEWYDDTLTNMIAQSITNFLPANDNTWREYFVTGTCTNNDVAEMRPVITVDWINNSDPAPPGGGEAARMDDVRVFSGPYAPPQLGDVADYVYHGGNTETIQPWNEDVPGLGGTKFLEFDYEGDNPSYLHVLVPTGVAKNVRARFYFENGPGDLWTNGTYLQDVEIDSASDFHGLPTVGVLTLEVWRVSFYPPGNWQSNMWYSPSIVLQDDTEWWLATNVDEVVSGIVGTNNWTTDPQTFWSQVPYDHDYKFTSTGVVNRIGVTTDWAYFNNTNYDPMVEVVPGYDGSAFMETDAATTTTTFRVITDSPLKDSLLPTEKIEVLMKLSWWHSEWEAWIDDYQAMSWEQNVEIDSASAFHTVPAVGVHTADLWSLDWPQPRDSAGQKFTNDVTVYYAPILKLAYGSSSYPSSERYLVRVIEGATNGWGGNNYVEPQYYGREPGQHDYEFVIAGMAAGDDTDGDNVADAWEIRWFGNLEQTGTGSNNDTDAQSDYEEWVADTDPTDPNSFYTNVVVGLTGFGEFQLQAGPPTTNSREYGVWYTTDLGANPPVWTEYPTPVVGDAGGAAVTLTVTNDADGRVYRTGVRIP